jgi:hypothetical protein
MRYKAWISNALSGSAGLGGVACCCWHSQAGWHAELHQQEGVQVRGRLLLLLMMMMMMMVLLLLMMMG